MRILAFLAALLLPTIAAAQVNCICLKCLALQHQMFKIQSSSMSPTLEPGACPLARRIQPGTYQPTRGDVVVFRHPVNENAYVMRVIGLPGDLVELRDGVVSLNGTALPQKRQPDLLREMVPTGPMGHMPRCSGTVGSDNTCPVERYRETLPNGVSYDILNLGDATLDNIGPFNVSEGQLFLLGDHRDNAADSRLSRVAGGSGTVPIESVYGLFDALP